MFTLLTRLTHFQKWFFFFYLPWVFLSLTPNIPVVTIVYTAELLYTPPFSTVFLSLGFFYPLHHIYTLVFIDVYTADPSYTLSFFHRFFSFPCIFHSHGGLVVRASALWAGDHVFDPRLRQTKVFKTGISGFPPRLSGLWEQHYDFPTSFRIMD